MKLLKLIAEIKQAPEFNNDEELAELVKNDVSVRKILVAKAKEIMIKDNFPEEWIGVAGQWASTTESSLGIIHCNNFMYGIHFIMNEENDMLLFSFEKKKLLNYMDIYLAIYEIDLLGKTVYILMY